MSSEKKKHETRSGRQDIAQTTLKAIETGSYILGGITHDLAKRTKQAENRTRFYRYNDLTLSAWRAASPSIPSPRTQISILEISTLEGAHHLVKLAPNGKIGILNFASAKKPGGGFLSGAQAQEESIARSSNLYPTLMTSTGQQYYQLHKGSPRGGFYSHSMIYSPGIAVFRDDAGNWIEPLQVDVLTSPAVNAGLVRKTLPGQFEPAKTEDKIAAAMQERMARILYLFEKEGVKNVVLGSFGTGVFRNKVDMVARIWGEHLSSPGARFKHSFDHVVFAVLGRETFDTFKAVYESNAADYADTRRSGSDGDSMEQ